MNIKTKFKNLWSWGKQHTFHFISLILIVIMGCVLVFQQTMLFMLRDTQQNDKKYLEQVIQSSEDKIREDFKNQSEILEAKVNSIDESVNARIDTIDNSLNIDEKRRELVSRIRKAIEDSTSSKIGARDLNRIANSVIDYSYEWNFTIPQILAQIRVESNFNPQAKSHAKAMGLMQIIPETLIYIEHTMPEAPSSLNAFNIYHNIRAGCFYMNMQIKEFGSYEQALRAYNWGPHKLRAYNAGEIKTMPIETQNYVPAILGYIEFYKKYGLEQ